MGKKEIKPVKIEKNEPIFDIIIEMLFLALIFLAPVIFDRRVGIVFSLTKVTTIRLLIICVLSIWAIKLLLKHDHKFTRTPMDYPVLSYIIACTVATLTSLNVLTSFMGFYGRYEGLSTLWMYGLIFFIATNFIKTKDQILRIMYTVIVAGVCMSLYGVIQRMGLDPYAWGGVITWQRIIGTIGQPNFLAAYVDMAFIIGLALVLNLKDLDWNGKMDLMQVYEILIRAVLIFSLFLIYVSVLYTQSRGGFLGLFGGASLFFLMTKRELSIKKFRELAILLLLMVIVTIITSLNPDTSPFGRVTNEISKFEEFGNKETPVITYSAGLSRLETWKSAYKIIADVPVFGIGQEVLKMVFPRYETNKFRFYEGFHVKQDRCHNEVCDMAVTRGTVTLFIYVWLIGAFYYMSAKIISGDYDGQMKLFSASFAGASLSYLIQNQFSFGVVAITTLFWAMMGITASIYAKPQQNEPTDFNVSDIPWLSVTAVIIFAAILMGLSIIQFRADMSFKTGKSYSDMRRLDLAISEYEKSLKVSPYESGTWTHMGIATLNQAQIIQNMPMLDKSLKIFSTASKIDPYNADNFYISGRAFYIISMSDPAMLERVMLSEDNALLIDPYYAEAYQIKGAVFERRGQLREAAKMYERAVEINPQVQESVTGLSNVYFKLNETGKLIDIFNEYLRKYPNNPMFQESLASIYVRRNEIGKAIKIYEQMIQVNPKNVTALVNLGFMSAKSGNITKAKESFESAVMIDPKNVDAHNGLGMFYLQTGQKDKARDEFNQVLMVNPNNEYASRMLESIK